LATSNTTAVISVNKRWLWKLKLLFLLGVLLAGRGSEGEGTNDDMEASVTGETYVAVLSCFTVTMGGSSILDAQGWHQLTPARRLSNLLRRPVSDDAVAALHACFFPSGHVPGEEDDSRRCSSSPIGGVT
jgi:hypothetical protein